MFQKPALIILSFLIFLSCNKPHAASDPQGTSARNMNEMFLEVSDNTPQKELLAKLTVDPDIRNFAVRAEAVFSMISSVKDTASRNVMIRQQLLPYAENMRQKWAAVLERRPDKNQLISQAVQNNFRPLPERPAGFGPCESDRAVRERKCNRTMIVDASLCSFAWVGGPPSIGACLVAVGAKAFVCMLNSDDEYNACKKQPAFISGERVSDWIRTSKGWESTPVIKPVNP